MKNIFSINNKINILNRKSNFNHILKLYYNYISKKYGFKKLKTALSVKNENFENIIILLQ